MQKRDLWAMPESSKARNDRRSAKAQAELKKLSPEEIRREVERAIAIPGYRVSR